MKKHLLFIPLLSLCFQLVKAQVPNAGFETWRTVSFPGTTPYEEPEGWQTTNGLSSIGGPTTVTKSTDKQSGTYAMKVATIAYTIQDPFDPSNIERDTVEGIAVAAFKITQKIRSVSGFYKCAPGAGDSVTIAVIAGQTKNGVAETIGEGVLMEGKTVSGFKSFTLNINYISEATPDSLAIFVLSSNEKAIAGSYIIVDNLSISTVSGTTTPLEFGSNNIYPNPAGDEFTIDGISEEASRIEFVSANGLSLSPLVVSNRSMKVSVADYAPGLYFFNVYDKENRWIQKGKFSKK